MEAVQRCILHGGGAAARGAGQGDAARAPPVIRAVGVTPPTRIAQCCSPPFRCRARTITTPVRQRALSLSTYNLGGVKIKPATDGGVPSYI